MLKILQARLQQYVNCELPDVQVGFRKGKKPEIKLPTSVGSSKKQESSSKTSTSALLITPKPLTVWITTNCGKFLKRWEYQTAWPASWEICMQVKKQQLELDMEQQTGSKLGKQYGKQFRTYSFNKTVNIHSITFYRYLFNFCNLILMVFQLIFLQSLHEKLIN